MAIPAAAAGAIARNGRLRLPWFMSPSYDSGIAAPGNSIADGHGETSRTTCEFSVNLRPAVASSPALGLGLEPRHVGGAYRGAARLLINSHVKYRYFLH